MCDRHLISDSTSEIDNNFTTHVKSKITFVFQPIIMPYPNTNCYYPKIWIVRYKHVPVTVESVTIQKFWIVTESFSSF